MNLPWTQRSPASDPDAPQAPSAAAELQRLGEACVVCELSGEGLIEAVGADAEAFLHAQLSSDVRALQPHRSQLSTYNSPKGRVLATLLLWRSADGFLLQLPASVAASVCKRLSMFVLRSAVRLASVEQRFVRFGLAGEQALQTLRAAGLAAPHADFDVITAGSGADALDRPDWLLKLPGSRYQVVARVEGAIALWQRLLAAGAVPGAGAAWRWLSLRSAIAQVTAATQDQFVPQMLNYELLGAVSFSKGCYPGQEIVARTQYRGEIKRRTLLLHARTQDEPAPAQAVYAVRASEQPVGTVLCAAPAPTGGYDALACVHLDLALGTELRLGSRDGPALEPLELPYALPAGR